jgi:hypothetical protein
MLRIKYLFSIIILIVIGIFVCGIKYYVKELERETSEITIQISEEKESIATLKAEWAYLNKPERLRQLVNKYLDLQPLELQQIHTANVGNAINKINTQKPVMVHNRTKLSDALLSQVGFDNSKKIEKIKWDAKRNKFIKIRNKSE